MPTSIRLFWWISVLLVFYGTAMSVWTLMFPDAQYLSFVAKMPASMRDQAYDLRIHLIIKDTLLWGVPILTFAWFAAFKRHNWARLLFAGLLGVNVAVDLLMANLLVQQLIGSALLQDASLLDVYFQNMARQNWLNPWLYLNSTVLLAATGLAFSPQARGWFARPKADLAG
jgi:hypothetical protein